MIQHCLSCDKPMHLRGGDMTTTCAECREKTNYIDQRGFIQTLSSHPLPRSEPQALLDEYPGGSHHRTCPKGWGYDAECTCMPHDLDARALKAKLEAAEARIVKLEAVAKMAREIAGLRVVAEDRAGIFVPELSLFLLREALAALDAK